jgi:transposase
MLLAHKIQLYPDAAQAEYMRRCIGARRFAYNALLAHFKQDGVKWSKKAAVWTRFGRTLNARKSRVRHRSNPMHL